MHEDGEVKAGGRKTVAAWWQASRVRTSIQIDEAQEEMHAPYLEQRARKQAVLLDSLLMGPAGLEPATYGL